MTEDKIEDFALGRLQAMRYGYMHGPTIAHDGEQPARGSLPNTLTPDAHNPAANPRQARSSHLWNC